jgi:hypothetical protein
MVGIVLISLAVLRIPLHLSRFGSAFVRGVSHTTRSGEPYFWCYSPPRRHNRGIAELSIAADIPFEFTLERENRAHWLVEKLGFASKYQTDDPESDRQVYIASDDLEFCDQLHYKAQMRRSVEYLFKNGFRSLTAKPNYFGVPGVSAPGWVESMTAALATAGAMPSKVELVLPRAVLR